MIVVEADRIIRGGGIDWERLYTRADLLSVRPQRAKLVSIKGARGVGKTTLMLQYIKLHSEDGPSVLYISLDDIWFSATVFLDYT